MLNSLNREVLTCVIAHSSNDGLCGQHMQSIMPCHTRYRMSQAHSPYSLLLAIYTVGHKRHHFLPRDAMQSAVLPWQVIRPSVCPSVTLIKVSCSYRLEFLENKIMFVQTRSLSNAITISI